MKSALALALFGLAVLAIAAQAETLPFAAHRAAYKISIASSSSGSRQGSQTPVAAGGLIGYEFRGSACEGYVSNFRQVTQIQRAEGEPIATDIRSMTFEDGQAKTMRFEIDGVTGDKADPPLAGSASRGADGDTTVDLSKPAREKTNIGVEILFPTQHLMHIIAAAKDSQTSLHARVFDGSDTGKKVFDTLSVIGRESQGGIDAGSKARALAGVRHWPVSISYFDDAKKDAPPEYVMSFDLFENGVTGNLKLDYGVFALMAELTKLELLPTSPCK